ncbi:hypothetical protein [Thiohalophilus sp.]|uniref:hypothetical protein n=1 Tax=Thiohalophilus sp. TaxID=3028392 RepID=UPI002ACF0849|nr:hypothetical protein [Thiohalophilus sp.]MDZ7802354.1 hypothetical protein [Thiohalophilus sp.]
MKIYTTRIIILILSFALLFTGCSLFKTTGDSTDSSFQNYQQQVNPFPVYDEAGSLISFPFLGINAPRPQFVDIDDHDPDLFVQGNTDDLKFFETPIMPVKSP